jgi:hypothetical protein
MPEGPAERGVEANASAHSVRSARHAESMDGAEHSGSIEPVMAGRHGSLSKSVAHDAPPAPERPSWV